MKLILSAMALVCLNSWGCASHQQVSRATADYLGAGPVHVLSSPTKIEGWNFQRADGSIAAEVPIRPLDLSIARGLAGILLDHSTYAAPAGTSGFAHSVGYRVWRNDESVDVLLSFGNDQMELKFRGANGQPISTTSTVAAARRPLLELAEKAFPDFKAPGRPAR